MKWVKDSQDPGKRCSVLFRTGDLVLKKLNKKVCELELDSENLPLNICLKKMKMTTAIYGSSAQYTLWPAARVADTVKEGCFIQVPH